MNIVAEGVLMLDADFMSLLLYCNESQSGVKHRLT